MEEKKILVVDDEEDICIFVKDLLERKGCKVFTASDTRQALDTFERERCGVVLIDIHMPFSEFDGLELLRRIKEIDKNVKCAMLTRIDDTDKVNRAKSLGADLYLVKPLIPKEIEEKIGGMLS